MNSKKKGCPAGVPEGYGDVIAGLAALVFMAHGSVLFSGRFGVDTELAMDGIDNFNKIGRQGLVWLAKLLGLGWFNLYYAQALTLFFMLLSPVAFGYLFYRLGKGLPKTAFFVFGASYICSVFWTAQIYFLNQSAQIACCGVLIPAAIFLLHWGVEEGGRKQIISLAGAWLLQQIIFSCYQVMIVFYVTAAAAAFLVWAGAGGAGQEKKCQWKWIGVQAGSFLLGFAGYLVIAKLFFMQGSGYLGGQLKWGKKPAGEVLADCFRAAGSTLRTNYPYYTGLYGIFVLILLVVSVRYLLNKSYRGSLLLFWGAEVFVILSPYVFCFFYGGELLDRVQLVQPLAQGSILYLIVVLFWGKGNTEAALESSLKQQARQEEHTAKQKREKLFRTVAAVALAVLVFRETTVQISYCNRLYYTDAERYAFDYQTAHDLYLALEKYKAANGLSEEALRKIVFVGYPEPKYNRTSVAGHTIGYSNLAFDRVDGSFVRNRMVTFMRDAGYPLVPEPYFTPEEKEEYDAYFAEYFGETVAKMPCFPAEESIRFLEAEQKNLQYLVVKFSGETGF